MAKKSKASKAAAKGWETRRANQRKAERQARATARKRTEAAKKGWETRKAAKAPKPSRKSPKPSQTLPARKEGPAPARPGGGGGASGGGGGGRKIGRASCRERVLRLV